MRLRYDLKSSRYLQCPSLSPAGSWPKLPASTASIPTSLLDGEMNWPRILGERSAANGNRCKYEARIAEQERLPGQAHPENEL